MGKKKANSKKPVDAPEPTKDVKPTQRISHKVNQPTSTDPQINQSSTPLRGDIETDNLRIPNQGVE